jgi:hypothetical protein
MLNESNAHEPARVAKEAGAFVLRGQLQCPRPESGDWEIGTHNIPDVLYQLRDREVVLILAPVDGGAGAMKPRQSMAGFSLFQGRTGIAV